MAHGTGTPPFSGFGPGALAWFERLAEDNSREYWAATKDAWQIEVRAPLEALLGELAAGWGGEVRMFRQHRDVRFSRDKSPLKASTYGVATRPGSDAGLYVAISADGLIAGTGYHELSRDQLGRYRAGVLDDAGGAELAAAVEAAEAAGLELGPPALKGTPRGVPRDHPRADLLRFTSMVVFARAPDEALRGRAALDSPAGWPRTRLRSRPGSTPGWERARRHPRVPGGALRSERSADSLPRLEVDDFGSGAIADRQRAGQLAHRASAKWHTASSDGVSRRRSCASPVALRTPGHPSRRRASSTRERTPSLR
jgi:uncharacterized protein (TIGR02453 family)